MKLNFDTQNLSRKQIVVAATAASLTLGFIGGWFAGRNALRNQFKESLTSSIDGLNNLYGESTENEAFEEEEPKTLDENGNEILDSLITTKKDPLTDETEYNLMILSDNKISKSYGSEHTSLFIRCKNKKTEVYFTTANFASSGDGETVKIRWDDGPIKEEYYGPAAGGGAFFSRAPKSFLSKANSAEKVVLNYDTYNRNETAVFKFGLQYKKDLGKMQKYCN